MKVKYILLVTFSAVLFSCNDANKASDNRMAKYLEPPAHHHDTPGLQLNRGSKWPADASTKKHVAEFGLILHAFDQQSQVKADPYKQLADQLQKELNTLIADCKMQGPEHDALHAWLMPVLTDVKKLKTVTSADDGKKYLKSLEGRLHEFDKYFI